MGGKAWCCGGGGSSGGGGGTGGLTAVTVADTNTVDLEGNGTSGAPITARVILSPDPNGADETPNGVLVAPSADAGNALTFGSDGRLYASSSGGGGLTTVTVQDTPTVDLSGDGTPANPITATTKVSTDPTNTLVINPDGTLYAGPPCLSTDPDNAIVRGTDGCLYAPASSGGGGLTTVTTLDTPTVTLDGDGTAGNPINAAVNVNAAPNALEVTPTGLQVIPSGQAGNAITIGTDGRLYAPASTGGGGLTAVAVQDTPSVDLNGDGTAGNPVTATVSPSADADNALTVGSDGRLFVATSTGGGGLTTVATADTTTVDLSGDGTAGNPITATVTSVPAGVAPIVAQDTPTIDMTGDGTTASPLTAAARISADADNALTTGADGALYVPTTPPHVWGQGNPAANFWSPGDPYDYTLVSFTAPEAGVYDVDYVVTGVVDSGPDAVTNWNVGLIAKADTAPGMEFWVTAAQTEQDDIPARPIGHGSVTVSRRVQLTAGQVVNGYISIITPFGSSDPAMAGASIDARGYWAWHKIAD
ncbi:hypothetical protein E1211_22645 [Micromonospora sp. 15K316]|uniref:hypothetical protein n=1 Tax=Micromonospora sp. 15K316 TaxID=2530376 RepID=UPI001051FBFC|nr:hypothetical protein [Micromonospora sp. 15K316]TDC31385.1 hypothetical protein E1211_22645 [Micromonospora sp. 15K316]